MAGIWERPDFDDAPPTLAILTTKANELAGEIHDRMPVILPISAEVHADRARRPPHLSNHLPRR
jgi:putative SOS response-associated peptidase YedK